ncbi:acylneuraminate cytidylyltransferase family protein [Ruthenibacterium sp. CLA-JM-H11]|uniref:Acylneuraminate cytidylyltransferase family protein n=1 Tax=Ruthenibacterium intestinale TaxID=3133163 RepID=A0ABV1GEE2_9FIRM
MENVLITICGRAGSKGFKNKNLKIFDGQPLSYYSLSAAQLFIEQHPELHVDVCLNTDSDLLIDVVTKRYPEVTVLHRPEELCGDVVPKMMVYQHSLRQMEALTGRQYENLIDLDITSPLRQEKDVSGAYEMKKSRPELDLVFSVCPARRTPYFNMAKLENGYAKRVIDHHFTARQQTPPVFDLNASIYVFGRKFLLENETGFLWDGKIGMYEMFDTGIIDIDSEEDYRLMEAIAHYLYGTYPAFGIVQANIRKQDRT